MVEGHDECKTCYKFLFNITKWMFLKIGFIKDNECWNYPILVTIVRKYFQSNDPWKIILVAFIRCI